MGARVDEGRALPRRGFGARDATQAPADATEAQNEGKPRAVPEAFRSNPPIKSVKETYAGALLLRNFQMRSGLRILAGCGIRATLERALGIHAPGSEQNNQNGQPNHTGAIAVVRVRQRAAHEGIRHEG